MDRLFLGAHGVDLRAGLPTPNLLEAETNRALVRSSRSVCVLAAHSKIGVVGLSTFMDLADVGVLIIDSGLGKRDRHLLGGAVDQLVVADVAGPAVPSALFGAGGLG